MVREDCVANREAKRSCTHKRGVRERIGLAARPEPFATRPEPGRALDCSVVAANLLAAEASGEKVAGRVFNVGGGASISILQLVEELNRLTDQTLQPRFEPARAGDVLHSCADISAIQSAIGFRETVGWREGLRRTVDDYRQHLPLQREC